MIQIETTADFDADGNFTVKAHAPMPAGSHRVIIQVPEIADLGAPESLPDEASAEPAVKQIGSLLVFTGKLLEDPESVRQRLDEERAHQLLYGPFE